MRYADLALAEPLKRAVADMGYEFMTKRPLSRCPCCTA